MTLGPDEKQRAKHVKRLAEIEERREELVLALDRFFNEFDISATGGLNDGELTKLLAYTHSQKKEPSSEAIEFIKKVADFSESGEINKDEMVAAVEAWETYDKDRAQIDDIMQKYDSDKNGMLDPEEVRLMLQDLTAQALGPDYVGPQPQVTQDDVDLVMMMCDISCNDTIDEQEVKRALAFWKSHNESKLLDTPKKKGFITMFCVIA